MKLLFPELEDESWKEHWEGMPQYEQEDLEPYRTLNIHFENEDDLNDFLKLINQRITPDTIGIWFPMNKRIMKIKKIFCDES